MIYFIIKKLTIFSIKLIYAIEVVQTKLMNTLILNLIQNNYKYL